MDTRAQWEVRMKVSGAVAVRESIVIDVMKGSRIPFLTTVKIANARHGVDLKLFAYGRDSERAAQSGLFFVGEMLNVLALRLNSPLHLGLAEQDLEMAPRSVRRIFVDHEWREMFELGRNYGQNRPVFARAISWYRRGLNSEDPIDKLLSIWLALEVIAHNCGKGSASAQGQIVTKIHSCFNSLWSNEANWKVIPGGSNELYQIKQSRNNIAHGNFAVHAENIQSIADEATTLQSVAHAFLVDWEQRAEGDAPIK